MDKKTIISNQLVALTGSPENLPLFRKFSEIFEGPIYIEAGNKLWSVGSDEGYLWYVQKGYGFDRILLEDGTKILNGMTEPGMFVCDEKSLLMGGAIVSDSILYTEAVVYRARYSAWREFMRNKEDFRALLISISAHFLQLRKLRLLKIKHMNKADYWRATRDRFPGIEKYCSQTEIAKYFGVSKSTMHRLMK
jgi:CRP-like cAMP-binding protein